MKYAKWIGGGLGWAFGGIIGAILGYILGSVVESVSSEIETQQGFGRTRQGDFKVSLLILTAAVMKADGRVLRSELEYVKNNLISSFGYEQGREAVLMLRDILKQSIPVNEVCNEIRIHMDYASRLQLVHFMYGIANADGHVCNNEQILIDRIASLLGLLQTDYISIKSMFVKSTDDSYKILGITKDATNEEVKRAYKKMAVKYHPDKVSYLGEDVQKAAKEKFQKVNEAYKNIKKERGIS